jgi:hypothetical protein
MKKPPRQVGKQFWDHFVAAPEKRKVKKLVGLKTRPAWLRKDHLGASPARRGLRCSASLKAADGDHLIPRPNLDSAGAGAAAQNCIGAVVERLKVWDDATPMDPDEGGREQLGWQLTGQVDARIVPTKRRSRNMQSFGKIFDFLSRGKTSVFPWLRSEFEEYKE